MSRAILTFLATGITAFPFVLSQADDLSRAPPGAEPKHEKSASSAKGTETGKDESEKEGDEKKGGEETTTDEEDKQEKDKEDEKAADKSKPKAIARPELHGFDVIPYPTLDPSRYPDAVAAYEAVRATQVHLKFGVAEHGHVAEFDAALGFLETAERRLAESREKHRGTPDGERVLKPLAGIIAHLKQETTAMRRVASSSLFGRFPLIRSFGLEQDDDEEFRVESYSMPGEARRRAIRRALMQIAKSAMLDPVYAVVLVPGKTVEERTASPLAEMVDAEAPPAFATVHDARVYLGPVRAAIDPMPEWDAPDPVFGPFCRQFLKQVGHEQTMRAAMIVMVREFIKSPGDGYWVQAQHRSFTPSTLKSAEEEPDDLEMDKARVVEALTRDRSRLRPVVYCGWLALLGLAVAAHAGLSLRAVPQPGGWQRWLAIPAAGFLIGLTLPPLIMLALARWLPAPQTHAVSGAWWPAIAGALSLILPAGVFRLAAGSAGRYFPGLSCHGRWGISFVPVAVGVSAAWLRPACYAFGGLGAIHPVAALTVAAVLLVYCFGRAIDLADQFPVAITPLVLALALVFGGGAFLGAAAVLWGDAAMAGLATAVHAVISRRKGLPSADDPLQLTGGSGERRPRTIEQLRAALLSPLYQAPPEFEPLRRMVMDAGAGQATWIGLVGPRAAGKSAAARELIAELQRSNPDVRVLVGRCTEESTPYQPFREALADLGMSAGLLGDRSQGGEVNSIFERLADEFIPFWDFFSGHGDEGDEASRSDVLAAVTNALHGLAQKQRVALFLDDIQWIDEGSAAVLKHLRENFAPGSDTRLILIVASRDPQAVEQLELKDAVLALTPPNPAQQVMILERSLGIEDASARRLVGALGTMGQDAGGMFWLMRAVRELASQNAFVTTTRGFVLRAAFLERGRLPVPAAMRAKLVESLRASGEHQSLLECAALLGETFRVDDLAQCLEIDRLKLLEILRHLDQDLQLVRDLPDEECYAFSSTFMHEIVCEALGVGGSGAGPTAPSKIAREWHARIARALERRSPRTPALTCAIARHYFKAGVAYASQSAEHCRAAAEIARKRGDETEAKRFESMARRSARRPLRKSENDGKCGTPAAPPEPESAPEPVPSDAPPSRRDEPAKPRSNPDSSALMAQ